MPTPAACECLGGRRRHGRRAPQRVVLGDVGRIGAVAPAPQVDPLVRWHTEPIRRLVGRDDDGAREVDVHHRDHVLGVRVGDHAVVRRRFDQLVGSSLRPGTRRTDCAAAISVMGANSSPIAGAVVVGRDTEVGPPGHVPQRERRVRLEHLVRDLGRMERRLERERRLSSGLNDHCGRSSAFFMRRTVSSASAPHTTATSTSPRDDRLGGVVDEDLRRRAADAGVEAMLSVRCRADRTGGRRVVVLPRLAVHDLQRLDRGEHVLLRAGVVDRGSHGLLPQHERLGRRPVRRDARSLATTPMMHGLRGSTAISGSSSSPCASRRTPSVPPWRPRWRTRSATAPASILYASSIVTLRPRSTLSFVARTASGPLARMRRAHAKARSISSSARRSR